MAAQRPGSAQKVGVHLYVSQPENRFYHVFHAVAGRFVGTAGAVEDNFRVRLQFHAQSAFQFVLQHAGYDLFRLVIGVEPLRLQGLDDFTFSADTPIGFGGAAVNNQLVFCCFHKYFNPIIGLGVRVQRTCSLNVKH